jgi:hypothetical protein
MDRKDWEDVDLTPLQKFSRARFWEHLGSTCDPRQGGAWKKENICSIEAVEFLGWTDKSDKTISDECASHVP